MDAGSGAGTGTDGGGGVMLAVRVARLGRDLWSVARRTWWVARGERQRILVENATLKNRVDFWHKLMCEYRDALFELKIENLPASCDVLIAVADEIDCDPGCEVVGFACPETGAQECRLAERGTCPFDKASQLRALAAALTAHASVAAELAQSNTLGQTS